MRDSEAWAVSNTPEAVCVRMLIIASGWPRGVREVVTERRLFQAHGTFYELPRTDSGGFRRVRPVATHNKHISDFASWRGLFVIAGLKSGATNKGLVFRSDDGGGTWRVVSYDHLAMGRPHYYSRMAVAPDNENEAYFLTASFARTIDGGATPGIYY